MVRLTQHQLLRVERLGTTLWPQEKLDRGEVARRLLLEYLLWSEDQRNMVDRMCPTENHKPSQRADPESYRWPVTRSSES